MSKPQFYHSKVSKRKSPKDRSSATSLSRSQKKQRKEENLKIMEEEKKKEQELGEETMRSQTSIDLENELFQKEIKEYQKKMAENKNKLASQKREPKQSHQYKTYKLKSKQRKPIIPSDDS